MGQAFGKKDASATNDVLNGSTVPTGTPGAQTVADPSQGISSAQQRNSQLASLALGTLGSYASGQQQQGSHIQPVQQQLQPQQQFDAGGYLNKYIKPASNPFFGRQ